MEEKRVLLLIMLSGEIRRPERDGTGLPDNPFGDTLIVADIWGKVNENLLMKGEENSIMVAVNVCEQ